MSNTDIWEIAIEKGYVILTKDADFYARSLVAKEKAKVIYFDIGNMTMQQLHAYFDKHWAFLTELIKKHDLIVANRESVDVLI